MLICGFTRRPVKFALYRIFNITVYAVLNVVFLWWFPKLIENGSLPENLISIYESHPKVIYIFVANLIASAFTFILFLPVLRQFRLGIDQVLLKDMLKYGSLL